MTTIPLTVVVLTKNEEDNIADCLGSVRGWADEIIVIDDESMDRTVELARRFTDRIFLRKMEIEGIHRNWAYAQARNEWVLSLDADEMVTEELKDEIRTAIKNPELHCYSIPLRNYIGRYWVRHGGWYPASKVRLFMKSRFRYEEVEVHPRAFLDGKEGRLTKDIIHKGYPNFEHLLASVNRQSTLEAKKWVRTGRRMTWGKAVWRMIDRFPRAYIGKKGYKDGLVGFMVAYCASLYQFLSYVKYLELTKLNKEDESRVSG